MRKIEKLLSERARFLLERDGKSSWLGGVNLGMDLVLPDYSLNVDFKGNLDIEYNAVESFTIYKEAADGTVITTSATRVLYSLYAYLGRYTVLDDLSHVRGS